MTYPKPPAVRLVLHAGALAALFLAAGCLQGGAKKEPPASRYAGMVDAENEGRHLDAIEEYEAVLADESRPAGERVRAMLRIARCREERRELKLAREAFERVLAMDSLEADEEALPDEGRLGIHFRTEAEMGLARIKGSPEHAYLVMLAKGGEGQKLVAIRSLVRLRCDSARTALNSIAGDDKESADLRNAARKGLESLDKSAKTGSG